MHHHQQHYHNHRHHGAGGGRGHARGTMIATPPPAAQTQCASYMQPSPASASSAVTTASGGDACSFGAATTMYSPSHHQAQLAHYNNVNATAPLAEFSPVPTTPAAAANSWAAINMAFDDMFLPELIGDGGEFPNGDLFGGFGQLLQDNRAPSTLQELSACYFPNAQAEMWAAAADVKPPACAGLCPSLT